MEKTRIITIELTQIEDDTELPTCSEIIKSLTNVFSDAVDDVHITVQDFNTGEING